MYKVAALLNFIIAAGHIICLPWLKEAFELCGMDSTREFLASTWSPLPYIISILMAAIFATIGVYALSAARVIRKLPYLCVAIMLCILVFSLRGAIGIAMMITGMCPTQIRPYSVAASIVIALLFSFGAVNDMKKE